MIGTFSTIEVSGVEAPVALITLNQPDRRNPISPLVAGELCAALTMIKEDETLHCVVLTGAGSAFSAGGDLSQMAAKGGAPPAGLPQLLTAMHSLGKPIIAMVNGHALAGGLGLMVACDLVVACESATFGTTEINLGLWPMMITAEITRNIGRKRTLDLMLTGRRIDAHEALSMGLVNRVCADGELRRRTFELAQELAAKSPATMALGLRAFYGSQDMEFDSALEHLEGELSKVLALEDAAEGVTAFLQKRTPVWKGR